MVLHTINFIYGTLISINSFTLIITALGMFGLFIFIYFGLCAMHLICVHQSQAFVFILSENYSETVYVPIDKKPTTKQKINDTQAKLHLYYIVCRNIT